MAKIVASSCFTVFEGQETPKLASAGKGCACVESTADLGYGSYACAALAKIGPDALSDILLK
jgi:hypothetical protein